MIDFIFLTVGAILFFLAAFLNFKKAPAFFLFSVFITLSTTFPYLIYLNSGDPDIIANGVQLSRLTDSIEIAFIPLFGFLCAYVGALFFRSAATAKLRSQELRTTFLPLSQLIWIGRVNSAVYALILVLIVVNPLGPAGLIEAWFRRVPIENFAVTAIFSLNVFASYLTLVNFIERMNRGWRLPYVTMTLSILIFWLSGGRVQLFVTIIPYVLAYSAFGRLNLFRVMMAAVAVLVLTTATLFLRLQIQSEDSQSVGNVLSKFGSQLELFSGYNLAADYTSAFSHDPVLYLKMLLQVIPRAIYEDKPEQISRIMRYFYKGDDLGGITIGIFGEFWVMFGVVGCLVGGALFGLLIFKLDRLYREGGALASNKRALLFSMIGFLTVFTIRGGLDNSIFRIAILMSSFAFTLFLGLRHGVVHRYIRSSKKYMSNI